MRFGLFVPQGWRFDLVGIPTEDHWSTMRSIAAHADAGVWESVWVYDHFHTTPVPSEEATHEAWTLMSALAASTSRVRLGQMCTCAGYRNPAYLAKVAATVDAISGGRVEMGIGGGWYEHEWRAYGYGFPAIGDRLGMLDETVQIFRAAWTDGVVSHQGAHFTLDGAIVRPLPLQPGGIPIWVAGGGEKVTLRIAAQYADYTNFGGTPEEFDHKSAVLRAHCDRLGRDFGTITRTTNYGAVVGETESEVEDRLRIIEERVAPHLGEKTTETFMQAYRGPNALGVGTVEQVTERLADMAARGLDYSIFYAPEAAYDLSGIRLLEERVIPALS
ncbi:LLM class F420-dependent oxidoreductase [Herbiconiux sp. CPCC 205763]|uniref:LLM class F420-dependent oxidoreductase n=1 Tax=Herbiconiux aconitum TaxID=2970913 RepID=A0ABT2GTX4_9MICO|nr:LLM class F420-dependent oxidoreductase [Herbiconiux aconitum]MCS5719669.1 LLM class F420-dependent oxidoreductase [Herbiconiux aconitum]